MAVALTITSTPQTFASGAWPYSLVNLLTDGDEWWIDVTYTYASSDSRYDGYHAIAARATGGIWTIDREFVWADNSDTIMASSGALTWSAAQTVRYRFSRSGSTRQCVITGATTGNTTVSHTSTAVCLANVAVTFGDVEGSVGSFPIHATLSNIFTPDVGIEGSTASTLGAATSAGSGALAITGTASATLGAVASTGAGTLPISASGGGALEAATLVAAGGAVPITGSGAATMDDAAASGSGTLPITGTASATLGAVTAAGSGTLPITGTGAAALAAATSAGSGAGAGSIGGTGAATLDDATGAGVGALAITAAAAATLDAATSAGQGALAISATGGGGTLADVTGAGVAVTSRSGTGAATLGTATSTGAGTLPITATGGGTLAAATSSGIGGAAAAFGLGVTSSAIDIYGRSLAATGLTAPGGYLPAGGGGADADGRTPTPVDTESSGSTFYAVFGRPTAVNTAVRDNKSNTYTAVEAITLAPPWEAWELGSYVCVGGAGGVDHELTTDTTNNDETTLIWTEIKQCAHMNDSSAVTRGIGTSLVSVGVDLSTSGWVIVDAIGDSGVFGAEGFSWTIAAVGEGATVGTHWQRLDDRIINHNDGWIPVVRWAKYFAAATAGITLTVDDATINPDQGVYLFAAAFQEVEGRAASGGATLAAATSSGTGELASAGTGAATLAAATSAGAGQLAIQGSAASTLDAATSSGQGRVAIAGTGGGTLEAAAGAGSGDLLIAGVGAATLDAATASGAGQLPITGSATSTLGDATATGAGTLSIVATGGGTLDPVTVIAAGALDGGIIGLGAATLGEAAGAGAGALAIVGAGSASLDAATSAGAAALAIAGSGAATLDGATAAATAVTSRTGAGAATLADATSAGVGGDTAATLPHSFTVTVGIPSAADFTVEVTP